MLDSNQQVLESSQNEYDVMPVRGNCVSLNVLLLQEGGRDADLLIDTTGAHEEILLCCKTAHGINPNIRTIARIRNPKMTNRYT
ncbi:MAG: hypothetical protein EOM14_03965 [Clostridia bacterium]|nr:hypothetical protein [Clostridia bacterium]